MSDKAIQPANVRERFYELFAYAKERGKDDRSALRFAQLIHSEIDGELLNIRVDEVVQRQISEETRKLIRRLSILYARRLKQSAKRAKTRVEA